MYGKGGSDRVPGIEGKAEVLAPHAVFLTISEQLGGPEFRSSGGRDRLCQCWMKVVHARVLSGEVCWCTSCTSGSGVEQCLSSLHDIHTA